MPALRTLLGSLPLDFPAAIAVVLHISHIGSSLVDILQRASNLPVRWAEDGAAVLPRTITVAPANRHLLIEAPGRYRLSDAPKVRYARPSADVLFESAAHVYRERAIGIVLTGFGRDGAIGVRALKHGGGRIFVQDEQTSAQFEMPPAAIATGAVDFVLPLEQLGTALTAFALPGVAALFPISPHFSLSHMRQARGVTSV